MSTLFLGLDIGGTKIAAGVVDASGEVRGYDRQPSEADGPEGVWSAVVRAVSQATHGAQTDLVRIAGVGVGCGGPMLWPAGIVSPLNLAGWRDFPLRARLADWLPGRPVRVHNDAVCFAVGEHWRGALRGAGAALGVVVSTGVGGGLLVDGRVYDGPTGNAGHIGHVVVEPSGPACECGSRGCLEAVARGPAISRWAAEHGWVSPTKDHTAAQLALDGAAGDPVAIAAFARAGRALGVALAGVANLLDLDAVAVGGGVAGAGRLLFEPLGEELARRVTMTYARRLAVVPAQLGPHAGVVGAAALVAAQDTYWGGD
ncbi:MAG: ROK family protein [Actinomycetota bacterium]|nr:ROK family protein [Actinomycetota bacterium]